MAAEKCDEYDWEGAAQASLDDSEAGPVMTQLLRNDDVWRSNVFGAALGASVRGMSQTALLDEVRAAFKAIGDYTDG